MRPATLENHRARIAAAQRHLAAHLDEPVDPAKLAAIARLSSRQLARVFTRVVGETPAAHARRLRIERAAIRLRSSRASILEIAIEAGFESHEAFTRVFRQHFGQTPTGYRRAALASIQPRVRNKLWQLAAATLRQHIER
jgi:AraC family transcriptional regulator